MQRRDLSASGPRFREPAPLRIKDRVLRRMPRETTGSGLQRSAGLRRFRNPAGPERRAAANRAPRESDGPRAADHRAWPRDQSEDDQEVTLPPHKARRTPGMPRVRGESFRRLLSYGPGAA